MAAPTNAEIQQLQVKAVKAKDTAYVPYSHFRVGACVLTDSGEYFSGCNVENAAYPVGICAEKNAISTAVAAGHRTFKALALSGDVSPHTTPCGGCRQFIREFGAPDMPVYMYDKDGNCLTMTVEQLLPSGFGPDDLDVPATKN